MEDLDLVEVRPGLRAKNAQLESRDPGHREDEVLLLEIVLRVGFAVGGRAPSQAQLPDRDRVGKVPFELECTPVDEHVGEFTAPPSPKCERQFTGQIAVLYSIFVDQNDAPLA